MKKILLFICNLLIISNLQAQKVTLDEALKTGLENRFEIKNQALQIQLSQAESDKLKARWLPQINANADFRWNTQLQSTILPAGTFGSNEALKLKLGTQFNNSVGVQADQKLYEATKKYDQKINETQVESQRNLLEQQKINVRQAITEAYYSALFNLEKIQLAEKTLERNLVNQDNAKVKFDNGTLLKNDLDRFSLDVSNAKLSLTKARQDYDLSLANLKYQMGLKTDAKIELSDALENILKNSQSFDNQATNIENRNEIKGEEINFRLNELNQQKQKVKNSPTISAYGNYSLLQLNQSFNPLNFDTWYPFNYIGLKATIPIFDGKQAKLAANDYIIRQEINKNNIEKYKSDFSFEAKNTLKTLLQTQADIAETKKNIDLARQIYETDKFRYEKGVITPSDLKNTEFSLQTSENNYLTSVYNFLLANVRYKKAIGSL